MNKAKGNYFKKIKGKIYQIEQPFDLVISKMVLEHIDDPKSFHKKVFSITKKDGHVIHFFATLVNIATLINLILPEFIAPKILSFISKRDFKHHDKFPAKYKWCFGPTKYNSNRFSRIGFQVLEYTGYMGHHYFWNFKLIYKIERLWNNMLIKWKNPWFCSNSIVLLKK